MLWYSIVIMEFQSSLPSCYRRIAATIMILGSHSHGDLHAIVRSLPTCNAGDAGLIPGSDPLEEEITHSSVLARKIPRAEEPGKLQSMGSQAHSTLMSSSLLLNPDPGSNSVP